MTFSTRKCLFTTYLHIKKIRIQLIHTQTLEKNYACGICDIVWCLHTGQMARSRSHVSMQFL